MDFSSEYVENSGLITQSKLVLQWTTPYCKHFLGVGWFCVNFTFHPILLVINFGIEQIFKVFTPRLELEF